jgi:hypothetical protein
MHIDLETLIVPLFGLLWFVLDYISSKYAKHRDEEEKDDYLKRKNRS